MPINCMECLFQFFLSALFFVFVFFLCLYSFRRKDGLPTKWPLIGMLPAVLKNFHRIHDFAVESMEKSALTFYVTGPWFTNMKYLVTADPVNAHYVYNKKFGNYPKGAKFQEIFDILGDGIFNADAEMWKYHRKMVQSVFCHPQFTELVVTKSWEKIKRGLIPILDYASEHRLEIELQDLFGRFALDTISTVFTDFDPKSLSIDLPDIPFSQALHDGEEGILYRHVVPSFIWKFQRWLGIGQEKKHNEAWKIIDDFVYECIKRKKEEIGQSKLSHQPGVDLMALYLDEFNDNITEIENGDKSLRDTIVSIFVAGGEGIAVTLSWLFYLLSNNPQVLSKVNDELHAVIGQVLSNHGGDVVMRDMFSILSTNFKEFNNKLVYLHAAIYEAIRLYPGVTLNAKAPIEADTLPSGHQVDPSMQIIFSIYAMGRMKSIWGEDCNEFKPERWILETGRLKYVPSHKFLAFNTGPRICPGKNVALTVVKAAAAAIISKYRIEPVEGHPVVPNISIICQMKYGFKVNVRC